MSYHIQFLDLTQEHKIINYVAPSLALRTMCIITKTDNDTI